MNLGGAVTNSAGGTISAHYSVIIGGAAGSVTNAGYIGGTFGALGTGFYARVGVYLKAGGTVTNQAGGTIYAGHGYDGVRLANGGAVINQTGGSIAGSNNDGVDVIGAAGTVTNAGYIEGLQNGVAFLSGGTLTNQVGGTIGGLPRGTIAGSFEAVSFFDKYGTLTNAGVLIGSQEAVRMWSGGTVTNQAGGTISGYGPGIDLRGASGYVINAGQIISTTGIGVFLAAGGKVINSGTISGSTRTFTGTSGAGVFLAAGGTVTNSGMISGGSGTAISFGGTGGNLLALYLGYDLSGAVVGSTSVGATNTLELSGTLGTVTATYNSLGLTDFQDVLFGASGSEILKANITTGTLGTVTLSGWTQTSEILDLTAVGTNATLANGGTASGNQLIVSNGIDTVTLQLDGSDATVFTGTAIAAR